MDHHPIADLFPMLAEDELRALAEDIKQRGQLQPIMLDDQGRILDGRNRNAACEIAEVEPWYETYDGDDPDGYALAVNINRRNLSKGQQGMVIARAARVTNNLSLRGAAKDSDISREFVRQANVILDHASTETIAAVTAGITPLNEAYKVANEKKASADAEAKALAEAKAEHARKTAELRDLEPDLAVLVENGLRTLDDAHAEATARATVRDVDEILIDSDEPETPFATRVESGAITWADAAAQAEKWKDERDAQLKRDKDRLDDFHHGMTRGLATAIQVNRKLGNRYITDLLALYDEAKREELQHFVSKIQED